MYYKGVCSGEDLKVLNLTKQTPRIFYDFF